MTTAQRQAALGAGGSAPVALVIDDLPESRQLLAATVKQHGFRVIEAQDGERGLHLALTKHPDLIFLDLLMPKLDGFAVLERVRERDSNVPVVIVSAADRPDVARRALELGAVNFLRKPFDPDEIAFVAGRIRETLDERADIQATLPLIVERRSLIELDNSLERVAGVVAYLARELRLHYPGHELPLTEIKLALYEAIVNGIEHGNLEIGYEQKTETLEAEGGMLRLIERRRRKAPYRDRKLGVEAVYRSAEVCYKVQDQGPGIPPERREPRPGDPFALHGRGLLLIRHYMDRVSWNEVGNEIRMELALKPALRSTPRSGVRKGSRAARQSRA